MDEFFPLQTTANRFPSQHALKCLDNFLMYYKDALNLKIVGTKPGRVTSVWDCSIGLFNLLDRIDCNLYIHLWVGFLHPRCFCVLVRRPSFAVITPDPGDPWPNATAVDRKQNYRTTSFMTTFLSRRKTSTSFWMPRYFDVWPFQLLCNLLNIFTLTAARKQTTRTTANAVLYKSYGRSILIGRMHPV